MRTFNHFVISRKTNKPVFAHWDRTKCQAYLDSMEDKDQYVLGHKWYSI